MTSADATEPIRASVALGDPDDVAGGSSLDDVLTWLGTAEARRLALVRLQRCGLPHHLADDAISDARLGVLRRMQSPEPIQVDNPAAYGTTAVCRAVDGITRGVEVSLDDLATDDPAAPPVEVGTDPAWLDGVRAGIEAEGGPPWLTSAALGYVTLTMHPDHVPAAAPGPQAGSAPALASAWAPLWFAGMRDLFPRDGADPRKRARARHIARVRAHVHTVLERMVHGLGSRDGGGRNVGGRDG